MASQRIFHFMHHAIPQSLFCQLKEIGAPQPHSRNVLSHAARYRTAASTATAWHAATARLDLARNDHAPLGWLAGRAHSNPWWDMPRIVDLMDDAFRGFLGRFGNLPEEVSAIQIFVPIQEYKQPPRR